MHFCMTGQYTPKALNGILENPTVSRYEAAKKLIEAAGGSPRLQERLLSRLLRQPPVSQHPVGDGVHNLPVRPVHLSHRVGIAATKTRPDRPVQHRSGRYHCGRQDRCVIRHEFPEGSRKAASMP